MFHEDLMPDFKFTPYLSKTQTLKVTHLSPRAVREEGSCLESVCKSVVFPLPLSPMIPTRVPVPTLPRTPAMRRGKFCTMR